MTRLILVRVGTSLLTLLLTATFVFFAVQALPGDVAQQLLGQDATPEAVATLREQLGLDDNVLQRFVSWLGAALTGDFGTSLVSGAPVADRVWQAFANTLLIAGPAIIVGISGSLLLGIRAAARRGTGTDNSTSVLTLLAAARMPSRDRKSTRLN